MYSADHVDEIAKLTRLTRDLGVNLAGVEIHRQDPVGAGDGD